MKGNKRREAHTHEDGQRPPHALLCSAARRFFFFARLRPRQTVLRREKPHNPATTIWFGSSQKDRSQKGQRQAVRFQLLHIQEVGRYLITYAGTRKSRRKMLLKVWIPWAPPLFESRAQRLHELRRGWGHWGVQATPPIDP